ncbi:DNA ligase [Spironucleus salmonicida]|uniref:DNA ligase n=1 Tax=Spironucleus salmonicida TaxID=348837 RepID=V6LZZ0_9EUKA|nr:DNA ligase [Spironucleus salmonicida]|eukprot:EST49331.1 DNA ligase [Spironucleus salmonicida]
MSFLKNPIILKTKKAQEPIQKPLDQPLIQSSNFSIICAFLFQIESTTKRLEKLEIFTKLLIQLSITAPSDITKLLLLLSNQVREPWADGVSFLSCGEQIVRKAISDVFSVKTDEIKQSLQTTGDLAISCEIFKKRQPKQFIQSKKLILDAVFSNFLQIADCAGNNSSYDRQTIIKKLLLAGSGIENRYIVRFLLGKNRLGLQRKTILFALSDFLCYFKLKFKYIPTENLQKHLDSSWGKIAENIVTSKIIDDLTREDDDDEDLCDDTSLNQTGSVDEILEKVKQQEHEYSYTNLRQLAYIEVSKAFAKVPSLTFLAENLTQLNTVKITPFIPILPMLAKPVSSFEEILTSNLNFFCEFKYDGFRAQIHSKNGKMQIFSRSQENMSERFPDVLISVQNAAKHPDFVIDGEIVPVDENGQILPFQFLSRRLKIFDSSQNAAKIVFFAFDLMSLNGVEMLGAPLKTRRFLLENCFNSQNLFQLSSSTLCSNIKEIQDLLSEAITARTEGLIIKSQASRYAPDRRSRHWTKLKKDYLENVGDSFDLVPVAGWYGKGKRAGVIGSYLLAARNGDEFQTVTCIGTGMSDDFLQDQSWNRMDSQPNNVRVSERYQGTQGPDFWINPEESQVWEVKVANLSLSLMHTCYVTNGRGIAARLPRLIRNRDDKRVSECTTAQFVFDRFNAQPDRGGVDEEDDFVVKDSSESSLDDFEE